MHRGLLLSVRVLGVLTFVATLAAGAANASSFVVMGETAPAQTPSIVTLGEAASTKIAEAKPVAPSWTDETRKDLRQAYGRANRHSVAPNSSETATTPVETPSIVAMGEPLPEVAQEEVAAIPSRRGNGPNFKPLIIRGGIVGDAFVPADKPEQEASSARNGTPPAEPSEPASPAAPPAYLPPNGLGKHRAL